MRVLAAILALFLAAAAAPATDELVFLPIPGDQPWKQMINRTHGRGEWERQFLPAGQRWSDYTDSVAASAFPQHLSMSPADALRKTFAFAEGRCEGMHVDGPTEQSEGGIAVAYAQLYCPHVRGRDYGYHIFYKALHGARALYVVNRDIRMLPEQTGAPAEPGTAPSAEMTAQKAREAEAAKYLADSVYLCGGTSTDTRCQTAAQP